MDNNRTCVLKITGMEVFDVGIVIAMVGPLVHVVLLLPPFCILCVCVCVWVCVCVLERVCGCEFWAFVWFNECEGH